MVNTGESAPEFTLPGTEGSDIAEYSLSDYTNKGAVVLMFYPFDFSPICTEVLCNFREAEWLTFTKDVDIFGISTDACYAHQKFIQEYDLPFPLLSDTQGEVTKQYGLDYDEWEHHKGVPKRALITIDDSETVRYKWVTEDAYQSPTLDELHQSVRALTEVTVE